MQNDFLTIFVRISAIILLVLTFIVGFYKRNHVKLVEEFATETNEKFYQKMVNMKENSCLVFDGFPTCLTDILSKPPKDTILITETDTLSFIYRDLDRESINKYPYYVIQDTKDNFWSLHRHNDMYILIKKDYEWLKDLLNAREAEEKVDENTNSLEENAETWIKIPQLFTGGFILEKFLIRNSDYKLTFNNHFSRFDKFFTFS